MIARVINAVIPNQGACRLFLPWAASSPSDGAPGGNPKPRKSSAVNVPMAPVNRKGINVSVATMALGSTCRHIISREGSPMALAARTYSRLRARKNSARTISTSPSQEKSSMIPSSHQKPGCTKLAKIINKNSTGSPDQISVTRWPMRSTLPPK